MSLTQEIRDSLQQLGIFAMSVGCSPTMLPPEVIIAQKGVAFESPGQALTSEQLGLVKRVVGKSHLQVKQRIIEIKSYGSMFDDVVRRYPYLQAAAWGLTAEAKTFHDAAREVGAFFRQAREVRVQV